MEWLTEWREGATEWLLSFLQNAWAWTVEVFGIIVQDPVPVAIWLGSSVIIIMLGLVAGSVIFRIMDKKRSDADETEADVESEEASDADDYDYDYDDSPTNSDRLFERRQ